MKKRASWLASTALVATLCVSHSANAATAAYSFEVGLDGFFGLGAAVSAEGTIGVTDGSTSLQYSMGAAGFVGARTETIPAELNNPPGVQSILFDLAVEEIPDGLTFADIGITIFGHDFDNGIFGIQNQFTDTVSITALGVGQHLNLSIDLDSEFFSGQSFNEIFGDDPADLDVASAFQFFVSKNAAVGLTVYIDNVRLVGDELVVPEPATGLMLGCAAVLLGAATRRRRQAEA
jgi:hypothetical protein